MFNPLPALALQCGTPYLAATPGKRARYCLGPRSADASRITRGSVKGPIGQPVKDNEKRTTSRLRSGLTALAYDNERRDKRGAAP